MLKSLMAKKMIKPGPIFNDVTTLTKDLVPGRIDVLTAGFPCPDISIAGHQLGLKGTRSPLFSEVPRLAEELGVKYLLLENVQHLVSKDMKEFFSHVVRSLANIGFLLRWLVLCGDNVGAKHRRARWFGLGAKSEEDFQHLKILVPKTADGLKTC